MKRTTPRLRRAVLLGLIALILAIAPACSKKDTPAGSASIDDFHAQIKEELAKRKWRDYRDRSPRLDRATLEKSAEMGINFMLVNQKPEGNFNYEYDWIDRKMNPDDNQVRQAGAVWGLGLIYLHRPSERVREALYKAWDFFFTHSKTMPDGSRMLTYPKQRVSDTGANALVALSIVEYLRAAKDLPDEKRLELEGVLDGFLKHIVNMRTADGHFAKDYNLRTNSPSGRSSPYYDGESLLCLVKSAKYLGKSHLIPLIEESAASMVRTYAFAWRKDGRPDRTKGFYQWGTMSFWEYQDAGWKDAELYRDTILYLAHWMIRTHRTLSRTRNTGYAYEGLLHAYQLAKAQGNEIAASEIARTADKALTKLMSWQVEGPLASKNPFLEDHSTDDPLAIGGFMNHKNREPHTRLRIDVTQHTLHAQFLAMQYIYTK